MDYTVRIKPGHDSPNPESLQRAREIINKIGEGWTKEHILQWFMERYNIQRCAAMLYYNDALFYIHQAHIDEREAITVREQQLERILNLLENSLKSKDPKTATKCLDMLNKIYQLYVEKKQVDVEVKDMQFKFGDEQ